MTGLERLSGGVLSFRALLAGGSGNRDAADKSGARSRGRGVGGGRFDHPGRALQALSVAAAGGILALFLIDANSRYRSAIADASASAQGFAEVLAEHTARTFEAVDRTLRAAETIRADAEAGRYPTDQAALQALRQLQQNSPVLVAIGWTNVAGDILAYSGDRAPRRANIADLSYFFRQRERADGALFISAPFRPTASDRWIAAASRPWRNRDGDFAGVVAAELDQSYFARIYQSVKPGLNGSVTLARRDGRVLTREPFDEKVIGVSLADDDLFAKYLPLADAGVLEKTSPLDATERIAAYRAVPGLPLVMLVTYDRSEALQPWRAHLWAMGPLVAAFISALLFGASILSRRTRELARQTALLQATLDNMDQGLMVIDEKRKVAVCNPRAMTLLDLPESMMSARPRAEDVTAYQTKHGEFIGAPPDVRERHLPRVFSERDVYERKRPNGTILEIQTIAFGNGAAVRTYKDVTKQKQVERELRDGEARYRLLAEAAADMIFQVNLDFVRVYVSPSSREILGYHRDGRWIWVESALRLIRDPDTGAPSGILGALRDISVRKAVEAEAIAARHQAEKAMAAQGQFLAAMSHELRTPLNSVLGFTGLILDRQDLAPDVRRQLGLIETASASLLTVVNDVLDFSKIEEGKLELSPTTFSLAALIEASVAIIRGTASKCQLDVKLSIDKDIPSRLLGDEARLRQVLLNLLNNAVKFTRQGSVSLTVQRLGAFNAGNRLRFVVSDTGIGIPSDKLGRLFERFSQVDGSISREYGGTGLGLAICKRLVILMGGEIGVESEAGVGSTFWFVVTFPAAAVQADSPRAALPSQRAPKPAHILLAEDVEVNQEIARSLLQTAGHRIDVVADGADAVAAVQNEDYDVVLMDIQMPGMDGVTATKRIRALPGRAARVPIIAMTANVLPQQVAAFRAVGMDDHVGKPFRREDLFAAIEKCLSAADRLAPLPAAIEESPAEAPPRPPPPAPTENSAAAFHAATFEDLAALLGREKIVKLLGQLANQLKGGFAMEPMNAEERLPLAREAHKLISSAGMLGFVGLSQSCAKLEAALGGETDATECFEEARKACRGALAEIAARMGQSENMLESA